jgi:hypothetical protein
MVLVLAESFRSVIVDLIVKSAALPSYFKDCLGCRYLEQPPLPSLSWSIAVGAGRENSSRLSLEHVWSLAVSVLYLLVVGSRKSMECSGLPRATRSL